MEHAQTAYYEVCAAVEGLAENQGGREMRDVGA